MEEIFVPAAGMALEEVVLSEWLKQPGDEVGAGEAVAVVETDKAMVELTPEGSGRLGHHLYQAGERIRPGTTVAWLLAEGEAEPAEGKAEPAGGTAEPAEGKAEPAGETANGSVGAEAPGGPKRAPHALSPRQRRERSRATTAAPPPFAGFSDAPAAPDAAGTPVTPGGRSVPGARSVPSAPATEPDRDARKAIADVVVASWTTTPHFSVGRDVDGEALLAALERARRTVPAATVTDFFLLALADALRSVGQPGDIGLAVATEAGVVIPVLRGVDGSQLASVTRMRRDAIDRARTRRLIGDDARVPFATLSNLGAMGVSWFTGVIPLGQTALVTIGELSPRPVVEGRGIAIRTRGSVTVTADHRRYDGADSARLLGLFVRAVEGFDKEAST